MSKLRGRQVPPPGTGRLCLPCLRGLGSPPALERSQRKPRVSGAQGRGRGSIDEKGPAGGGGIKWGLEGHVRKSALAQTGQQGKGFKPLTRIKSFAEGSRVLRSAASGSPRQTLARAWRRGIWTWHPLPPTDGVKIAFHQPGLREARELLGLIYLAWFPLTVLVNQFGFDSKNNSVLRAPHTA